jgi:hypothetical protein
MFLFSQLHYIELIVEISILFRLQKIVTEHGWFVMLQSTIRTSPKILIMRTMNEVVKAIFTTGDCLNIILFGPNLIIRLRFDVPNTELRPKHWTALTSPPRLVRPTRRTARAPAI